MYKKQKARHFCQAIKDWTETLRVTQLLLGSAVLVRNGKLFAALGPA